MSIMEYNGSGIVAMVGKKCVAIASDMRFGVQQTTIAHNMHKVHRMNAKTYVGLAGLITDMQTVHHSLTFKLNMYKLREERDIKPSTCANLISNMLYAKRFGPYFVEPIVCGLEDRPAKAPEEDKKSIKKKKKKNKEEEVKIEKDVPFICAMDLIGAPVFAEDFVVSGTSSQELYGVCEAMYKPNMEPDELFEVISQCLLAAVDRDCLAGWGAIVHIITPEGVTSRELKSRQD
eukprot:gb/GEZN01014283.1/.p1 GENE.gb/GEZN01014283.1/~~gb/GEZN01014283.1/.p1  ORF type:complete len:233 (-),score=39.76 gb/GEZN01014283.1/:176-874(-)